MFLSKFKFAGGRVVKTGIGVFVTALLCKLFDFNPIFAVITAIVTIEPTASDSIKKGIIRFPSAAIGAAFSMIFTAILGDQPVTYALAAIFTIMSCHKLNLEAGILVATLTAVNMIPITHDHYFGAFLERLGTTTIGLSVSTIVNILILPPHYTGVITKNTASLFDKLGALLKCLSHDIMHKAKNKNTFTQFTQLMKDLEKTEQLCQYQREEWKYHRHTKRELREFHYEHKKLIILRQMLYHIGNLMYVPFDKDKLIISENSNIIAFIRSLADILLVKGYEITKNHEIVVSNIREEFSHIRKDLSKSKIDNHYFSPESVVLFELIALNELTLQLYQVQQFESKYDHPSINKKTDAEKILEQ